MITGFLKAGAIASLVLVLVSTASAAAACWFFDASRLDAPQRLEPISGDLRTLSHPVRLAAEQQTSALPTAETARQNGYQACLDSANAARDAARAAECKRIGEKDRRDYANCVDKLNLSKTYCDAAYTIRDVAPNCVLPPGIATGLDAELESARNRCLQQSKAASP